MSMSRLIFFVLMSFSWSSLALEAFRDYCEKRGSLRYGRELLPDEIHNLFINYFSRQAKNHLITFEGLGENAVTVQKPEVGAAVSFRLKREDDFVDVINIYEGQVTGLRMRQELAHHLTAKEIKDTREEPARHLTPKEIKDAREEIYRIINLHLIPRE